MKKFLSLVLITSLTFSLEFQPLGFRAVGMGGAGVASASGSNALYYNPALLAYHNYSAEFSLEAGIGGREINLINPLDKLVNEDELDKTLDNITNRAPISGSNTADGTNKKMEDALKQIYRLSVGNGLSIMPTVGFGAQMGSFGIGVYGEGEISASAVIDREHLYVIIKDDKNGGYYYYYPKTDTYGATDKTTYEKYSLVYALDNNLTYVRVKGLAIAEVPIGYGYSFDVKGASISIGVALKYLQGITYFNKLSLKSTDEDKLRDSLTDNSKTTSTYGVDVGLLIKANKIKFGIVGKDLNSPKFDFYNGTKYTIKPLIRGGVALDLADWLTFAMDIDLRENNTFIPGYKSQYIGGGVDIHPGSWISIRAGAMRNMQEDDEGTIVTAGFGLGLKWFQLDLSAQAATKTGTYQGNEIPRYFKVNLALLSRWGG